MVGNGTSTGARSNALTILKDGRTGLGTSSPQAKLHVQNGEVLMTGTWDNFNYLGPLPATGAGTRLMWIPGKAAFRVGRVSGNQWDLNNIGDFSTVVGGVDNEAFGDFSFVGGGIGNRAGSYGEVVLGTYSAPPSSYAPTAYLPLDRLFVIGNGTDDANRSNALTMLKNGNTALGGSNPGNYRLKVIQTEAYGLNLESFNEDDWEWFVNPAGGLSLYQNAGYRGAFDATSGTYTATSDARLKTGITALTPVMDKVMQLRPSQYQYKQDERGRQYLGFIAQEVEPLFPELVRRPDPNSERESWYTLDYSGFGIVAIKAIQEQQAVIETQQARIDVLESQLQAMQALEARLTQLEAAVQP